MEGLDVRLADGEVWAIPVPEAADSDPEFDALVVAAARAEDRHERLLAELSLTILLLGRHYELSPEELSGLLSFSPGDPALPALQEAVHDLVVRAWVRSGESPPRPVAAARLASRPAQAG